MAPGDVAGGRLPENSNVNLPHSIAAGAGASAEEAEAAIPVRLPLFDALPLPATLLDQAGTILLVNAA
ncbi:MAG: hypothetical protein QJR07_15010 [Acetobacteraceae bacterium]|nr:hypothetical protein [Microbispora sp.]MDI3308400.1 hypothetical protein [Acetobacteraceae bacterium]